MNLCITSPKKYDLMYVPQPRGIGLPGHWEGRGDVVSSVSWFITPSGHMGDCQNYGPFLGPHYNTGPNLGDPKRGHNFDNSPYDEPRYSHH